MNAEITRTIAVTITPDEAAKAFASWFDGEQVAFLNALAAEVPSYQFGWGGFASQLQYISDNTTLTSDARRLMQMFGEYAPVSTNSEAAR